MSETKRAVSYPEEEQYEVWEDRAEEMGYRSTSQFIQDMVEAGSKKFTVEVEPDETKEELRDHRNDLKDEIDKARSRIRVLEEQLYNDEKAEVETIIEENPGVEFPSIVQEVVNTVPSRVNRHLDELEGDKITIEDGHYYPDPGEDQS